jgi:transcriptional adapter 2-alpha
MSRDYYASERLSQLRTGTGSQYDLGYRHPEANVSPGESEGRRSHERESTPKLGAGAAATGTGPPTRRPRKQSLEVS